MSITKNKNGARVVITTGVITLSSGAVILMTFGLYILLHHKQQQHEYCLKGKIPSQALRFVSEHNHMIQ